MLTKNVLYTETVTMVVEECCNCGILFGMPSSLNKILQNDPNKHFYCPNGHSQHFAYSKVEKEKISLQKQLETEREQSKKEYQFITNRMLDELNKRKKVEKKLKRVENGVCPCCNRSFINLQKHMKTQHPNQTITT